MNAAECLSNENIYILRNLVIPLEGTIRVRNYRQLLPDFAAILRSLQIYTGILPETAIDARCTLDRIGRQFDRMTRNIYNTPSTWVSITSEDCDALRGLINSTYDFLCALSAHIVRDGEFAEHIACAIEKLDNIARFVVAAVRKLQTTTN